VRFPGSLVPFGTLSSIPQCIKKVNVSTLQKQGFSKVTFSRACWPLSVVACGDREDFLQFLRMLPSRGKATYAETAKENHAEAEPLHERNFCEALFQGFGCGSFFCRQAGGGKLEEKTERNESIA